MDTSFFKPPLSIRINGNFIIYQWRFVQTNRRTIHCQHVNISPGIFHRKNGSFRWGFGNRKMIRLDGKNPTNNTDSVVLVDICQFVLLVVSTTRTQCVNVTWTYGTKFGASMDPHGCSQSFGPQTEVEISPTVMDLKTMF